MMGYHILKGIEPNPKECGNIKKTPKNIHIKNLHQRLSELCEEKLNIDIENWYLRNELESIKTLSIVGFIKLKIKNKL